MADDRKAIKGGLRAYRGFPVGYDPYGPFQPSLIVRNKAEWGPQHVQLQDLFAPFDVDPTDPV